MLNPPGLVAYIKQKLAYISIHLIYTNYQIKRNFNAKVISIIDPNKWNSVKMFNMSRNIRTFENKP